ncbi:hypothetical protein ABH923_002502 [Leifsonia sp. EB41]|uniref:hypothetical protein n=1 Tax=Leifsonia sp. EB41 TaxID=3156260 RepID=UPI0035122444
MDMDSLLPEPMPWGANDAEATELCRRWMIYLGASDTVVASGDDRRACDLYSSRYLGWVDNRMGNLEVELVERSASVAIADGRAAVIFVRRGVLPAARQRADELGVAILGFDPQDAALDGANLLGREVCASGLAD